MMEIFVWIISINLDEHKNKNVNPVTLHHLTAFTTGSDSSVNLCLDINE
jgi:hypothetical protein